MSVNVKFTGDAKQLEAAQKRAVEAIQNFETKSAKALNKLTGNLLQGRGAMVALAGSATFLKGAVAAAVDFEKLNLGLRAVADESENVEEHIGRLKQLAKNPGLGFEQAQQGSIKLQGVGFQIKETEQILKEFGNAVALSGNGAPELARITTQLGQLAAKGKVLTQDLRPIIEAAPVVSRALKAAFGTVSADDIGKEVSGSQEFIERLLKAMEDLPRAPKSAAESFQNMRDSAKAALAEVGEPIVKELVPALDSLVDTLDNNEQTLQNVGKGLAFVVTTAGKLSPILGAVAVAYVAVKAAQLSGNLAGKLGKQILALKSSAAALTKETAIIKSNTAAQKANAAARQGSYALALPRSVSPGVDTSQRLIGNFKGADALDEKDIALIEKRHAFIEKLQSKAGKKSGVKSGRAFVNAFAESGVGQASAVGVSIVGAIGTTLLPESKLIGGKSGSAMLDGISGALALAGPLGIVASLGIQAVKAGYALGETIADAIYDEISDGDKVRAKVVFTEDYFDAVSAGNRADALDELTAKRAEFNKIVKEGNAEEQKAAKENIQVIDLRIKNLDNYIAKLQERKRLEEAQAAQRATLDVQDRGDISTALKEELRLLAAKAEGNQALVAQLEREKRIAGQLVKLEKEGTIKSSERLQVAIKIVNLQDRAKAGQQRQNELAKEALEIEKQKERSQQNVLSLYASSLEAYRSTLSLEEQLLIIAKQRAALLKQGGGSTSLNVLQKAQQAQNSGKVEEAERLFQIGKKLLELEQKKKQLAADVTAKKETKQGKADSEAEFKLQQQLLELRLSGDEKAIKSKEREISLLAEAKTIQSQLNVSRKEALKLAEARLNIQEKIQASEKAKQVKQDRGDFATNLKALELEASGRKKEADALREKAAILSRAKDLQEQLNLSAAKALELARKENEYKKQIEKNSANKSTNRTGGIKRDTGRFGSRDRSVIDRVKRTNDGDLTLKIKQNAVREKQAQAHRNDPSLAYLQKLTDSNNEMVKIWRGISPV